MPSHPVAKPNAISTYPSNPARSLRECRPQFGCHETFRDAPQKRHYEETQNRKQETGRSDSFFDAERSSRYVVKYYHGERKNAKFVNLSPIRSIHSRIGRSFHCRANSGGDRRRRVDQAGTCSTDRGTGKAPTSTVKSFVRRCRRKSVHTCDGRLC